MLQCSGINLGLANLLSSSLGPATRGADAGLSLCLSTPPASPRNTIIPGAWCPWSQQGSPRAEMMSSTVRDFHSDIPRGDEISPSRGSSSFVPTPCSLLKLSASNPAVYFRRCQSVSLWLFMASDVFPFTAYFRCNKKETKGPLKGNALSWHYLLCGMFLAERMLPVPLHNLPCYLQDALFADWFSGLVSHPSSLQCTEVLTTGCKKRRCWNCGWRQLQPKCSCCSGCFCILLEPGQPVSALAEKLGKSFSLARCCSFLSFLYCY